MRIIICGAGRVGQGLAERLLKENHTVTFIDTDPVLVEKVTSELDVQAVQGKATHPSILAQAGAKDTDAIIAVTLSDEINMVTCQMAHAVFGISRKIARIRDRAYLEGVWSGIFAREGFKIDLIISPEMEVAEAVLQRLEVASAFLNKPMCEDLVRVLGIAVDNNFPLLGREIAEISQIFPDFPATILAIVRDRAIFVAQGNMEIQKNDRLYVLVSNKELERALTIMGQTTDPAKHIIIVGAGNVGLEVAKLLEAKGTRTRLIETDYKKAEYAASNLNRTIVLQGDGLNGALLEEAGVSSADAVIALTNDDKSNLLITNFATRFGAKRALALINDPRLAEFAGDLMRDVPLDPRALTISKVLLNFRHGNLQSLLSVEGGKAEIVEGKISEKSPLIGKGLAEIKQTEGYLVGAIVHNGEVSFLEQNRRIQANDNVVVFFESRHAHEVEKLFRLDSGFF